MKIHVYGQKDKFAVHDLQVQIFTQQERTKRSLIRLFSFWGFAIAAILIPVFHFILVPLFFLLAPFLAHKRYKEKVQFEACTIPCPECHQTVPFSKNTGDWPLHDTCPQCMNRIYFNLVN